MLPAELRYFTRAEFRNPDLVDNDAALFLDELRHRHGFPLHLTDDAREPDAAPPGSSKSSMHYRGRAFDLKWIQPAHRLYNFVECAMQLARERGVHIELEIVNSLRDRHVHIALQPPGVWDELIVAAD